MYSSAFISFTALRRFHMFCATAMHAMYNKVGWGKMGQWGKMGHLHFRGSHCLPEGTFKLRRCMSVTPSCRQPLTLISSPQEVLIESKGQNNEDRWNAAFMRTK